MHWRTFWRLFDEHEQVSGAAVANATPLRKLAEIDV
jgi:hypothetical protein